jgi:uncharacterized membrane protein YhaH (DUF805 family)
MGKFRFMFFSFDGRISRREFWAGAIALAVAALILGFILMPVLGMSLTMGADPLDFGSATDEQMLAFMQAQITHMAWGALLTVAILAWPALALLVKRAHDTGRAGMLAYAYVVIVFAVYVLQALGVLFVVGRVGSVPMPIPTPLAGVLYALVGVLSLILLVTSGFLKGTPGSNPYGIHPRERQT